MPIINYGQKVIDSVTIENAPQYMQKFMKIVYGI